VLLRLLLGEVVVLVAAVGFQPGPALLLLLLVAVVLKVPA